MTSTGQLSGRSLFVFDDWVHWCEMTVSLALIDSFKTGLRETKGDRLVDVLEIVRYCFEHMEDTDEQKRVFINRISPELIRITGDIQSDAMLRGIAGVTLLEMFTALGEMPEWEDRASLVTKVESGLRQCLAFPTAVRVRKRIEETLAERGDREEDRA